MPRGKGKSHVQNSADRVFGHRRRARYGLHLPRHLYRHRGVPRLRGGSAALFRADHALQISAGRSGAVFLI